MLQTLWRIVEVVMAALLFAMVALVFTNGVLRYGFSSGLRLSVELWRLGLVWLVMLGAAVVLRRNELLAVTEYSERLFPAAVRSCGFTAGIMRPSLAILIPSPSSTSRRHVL